MFSTAENKRNYGRVVSCHRAFSAFLCIHPTVKTSNGTKKIFILLDFFLTSSKDLKVYIIT